MTANKTYRDETESVHARVAHLEAELAGKTRSVEDLERQLSDQDAVFTRLEGVIDNKDAGGLGRWSFLGGVLLAGVIAAGGTASLLHRPSEPQHVQTQAPDAPPATSLAPSAPERASAAAPPPPPLEVCKHPGVHFTLAGGDAIAPAQSERDLGGHKYRRDGSRYPWLTVQGGPLYVHAVGDYLPGDLGTTRLSILTLVTRGDTGGYALAHGGRSSLEVQGSDGTHIYGRFEADVSKVADTTRPAPFGTPVERVRGTFCLPAMRANPSDTGP